MQTEHKTIEQLMKELSQLEATKKEILEQEADLKAQFLELMQQKNINVLSNTQIKVNYVAGFIRKGIDAEKLRKKYPDAAQDCAKSTPVSPFVKVMVQQ